MLTVTQMLRKKGVVGKFVEFFGSGLSNMTLADRATIGNMAPEYGATCGFFPVDAETIRYLTMSGRAENRIALVEQYAKAQGMWRESGSADPVFTDLLQLDLGEVVPSMAGPKRPEGRQALESIADGFEKAMETEYKKALEVTKRYAVEGESYDLGHGDVVIAAITSCTNTSNPSVLMGAGLLARNANRRGLKQKPWVKTSLAPGSQVVAEYLEKSGLQKELDQIGFNLVGFGCTTCIGNSGPLPAPISRTINDKGLIAAAVLSGNRNFEGRVSPDVQANYLASPPLVVAYALAGTVTKDLTTEPLGDDRDGNPVFLKDIWPDSREIDEFITKNVTRELFARKYADVFKGDDFWRNVQAPEGETYAWDDGSTYVQNPPYFVGMRRKPGDVGDVKGARVLGLFGDKITTDHISPAGSIKAASPAGKYLMDHGVGVADFNQYGTRRGNHEVMMRGTFANIRIRNHMLGENGREGGYTIHYPSKEEMPIYDAAMRYKQERRAAGDLRRRRIRQRLVARLGGQGHQPARRARRDRAVLRADPPLQPGRHGRRALRLRGGNVVADAGPEGRRDGGDRRPRAYPPAPEDAGRHHLWRRHGEERAAGLPHRYGRRARLLQEWRHPAIRAARPRCLTQGASDRIARSRRAVLFDSAKSHRNVTSR